MAIVIVGFMGVGKSTIGKLIAEELKLPFVDLDEVIIKNLKLNIPEIFDRYGENFFRKKENEALTSYINMNVVIATGGGIVENPNNLRLLRENKMNLWVDTNIDTVYNRIAGDSNRPNANHKSKEELKRLYNSRISRYNEIAYIKVDNDTDLNSSVQTILNHLKTEDEN
ncbi:shikimate kinase [Macrococcus equi]|uniref:shikimate kinase n=1 Tax=Macrococcus equi TaxID=3395462 RepID=UPI0039BEB6CB